jgi:hypothetical protein
VRVYLHEDRAAVGLLWHAARPTPIGHVFFFIFGLGAGHSANDQGTWITCSILILYYSLLSINASKHNIFVFSREKKHVPYLFFCDVKKTL